MLHAFTGPPDGQEPLAGLVFDKCGNLYGTTWIGEANGCGTVFKLTPRLGSSRVPASRAGSVLFWRGVD